MRKFWWFCETQYMVAYRSFFLHCYWSMDQFLNRALRQIINKVAIKPTMPQHPRDCPFSNNNNNNNNIFIFQINVFEKGLSGLGPMRKKTIKLKRGTKHILNKLFELRPTIHYLWKSLGQNTGISRVHELSYRYMYLVNKGYSIAISRIF